MLYLFDRIETLDDSFPEHSTPYLSEQRREKVFAYRFLQDKKLSAAVYLLLRHALRESYRLDEPVVFAYGRNGKPVLRDHPRIHFSLSHCRAAVACAVSDREVGVDVQDIAPVSDKLAKRVLTGEEYAAFKAAGDPARHFCEVWTVKESYLKKTGQGIGVDLWDLPAANITEATLFSDSKDYCCCLAGAAGPVEYLDYLP